MGAIFTSIFAGSLITQIFLGPVSDKFGQQRVLWISLIVMGLGVLGYSNISNFWLLLVCAFFGGLGQGGVDIAANVITTNLYGEKSTPVLNLLHFFFGFGALAGPAMVSLSISTTGIARMVLWAGGILLIILAVIVYLVKIKLNPVIHPQAGSEANWKMVYSSPLLWFIGVLLLLHVGVENGLGGWVTTYLQRTTSINLENAALSTSAFWGALTIGRLLGIFTGRRLSNIQQLAVSLIGSLVGCIVFSLSIGSIPATLISIIIIGFTMGTVYPTMMSVVSMAFKKSPGTAVSLVAALGSVGGMLVPLGQGYILEQISPLASTWYITVLFIIIVGLIWMIAGLMKRSA